MSVCRVRRMGDPALSAVSVAVGDLQSPEVKALIQDMWHTVLECKGTGISAPQIGAPHRIVIFGVQTPRYVIKEKIPTTVLINPEITVLDDRQEEDWEGCLSVPGIRGLVPRAKKIAYCGYDPEGNRIEREASGFHARTVQHECDHLDGILFLQRMTDMKHLGFEDELGFSDMSDTNQLAFNNQYENV